MEHCQEEIFQNPKCEQILIEQNDYEEATKQQNVKAKCVFKDKAKQNNKCPKL